MSEKYIKIKEASEILGVSKLTLRNWDKSGKLPSYRHPINNYRIYKSDDIDKIFSKIESGERIFKSLKSDLSTVVKDRSNEKPKTYTIKVTHLSD